eukprot:1805322-Prymnesium_polylepis.2
MCTRTISARCPICPASSPSSALLPQPAGPLSSTGASEQREAARVRSAPCRCGHARGARVSPGVCLCVQGLRACELHALGRGACI